MRAYQTRKKKGESQTELAKKTPLKKEVASCVVNGTPLSETFVTNTKTNPSALHAARRLDNLQHGDTKDSNGAHRPTDKENVELEVPSDSSDLIDTSDEDEEQRMKRFLKERDRIKQTKQQILEKLAIVESTNQIRNAIAKEQEWKRAKFTSNKNKKRTSPQIQRKSLRLLKRDPEGIKLADLKPDKEEEARNPGTLFPMTAVGFKDTECDYSDPEEKAKSTRSFEDYNNFMKGLSTMMGIPDCLFKDDSVDETPAARYQKTLQSLKIVPEHVQKVTKERIFSVAIHPSLTEVLVAAGDKYGNLGLWKPLHRDSNGGTYQFTPHVRPISCLKFSTVNSNTLYMCSYDGQLRYMDLQKTVFENAIIDDEDATMSGFDFMDWNNTLVTSRSDGCVSVVDTRVSAKDRAVVTFEAHNRAAKSISCHPLKSQYVATAHRDGSVFIFDIRGIRQKQKRCKPVVQLLGHSRSVSSAYFSPTGNQVLTTSYDDHIRVFDTTKISSDTVKLKASCYHNNNTGRWLSSFRATWHPSIEDVFVVGSMERPRRIETFSSSAKLVHAIQDRDILTTVCSLNCFHETRDILIGGNSSGKVFMFSNGL